MTKFNIPVNTAWLQIPTSQGQISAKSISISIAEQQEVPGDADGDGQLTVGDIVKITDLILGKETK